jgi:hypothetical protein
MSPRPEKTDFFMYNNFALSIGDRIRAYTVTKNLVQATLREQELLNHQIVINGLDCHMSHALLVRGNAINQFIMLAAHKHLLPKSGSDSKAFDFWSRKFGIDINYDKRSDTVSLVHPRPSGSLVVSWKDNRDSWNLWENQFLSDGSLDAIIAMSIVPDSYWPHIAKHGMIFAQLRGDICDAPWDIPGIGLFGAILPNTDNLLSPHKHTGLLSFSQPQLVEDAFFNVTARVGKTIDARKEFRECVLDPLGIFADLRTMK